MLRRTSHLKVLLYINTTPSLPIDIPREMTTCGIPIGGEPNSKTKFGCGFKDGAVGELQTGLPQR